MAPGHRALLLPLLAAVHLGVIIVLVRMPAAARAPVTAAMTVMAIPEPQAVVEAVPPPVIADIAVTAELPEFVVAEAIAETGPGPCDLTADIAAALRGDARIPAAIGRIPAAARSVSNSLLLWDGAWARSGAVGGAEALGPIRDVVAAHVRAASPACRQEAIVGPRLMVVPEAKGQIVLAFGSGKWTWERLL